MSKLKLILLPGMDGTGHLFSPLLQSLSHFDCEIIALPTAGDQSYLRLSAYVQERLPKEDFILIAESFSGPIAAILSTHCIEYLRGVIFVATFLSVPHKRLLGFARRLPLNLLSLKAASSMPLAPYIMKRFFLGKNAGKELLRSFQETINQIPTSLIRDRLDTLYRLSYSPENIGLPVAYIQARYDKLVPAAKLQEFEESFTDLAVATLDGPHFILQAKPAESAAFISDFVLQLEN